MRRLPHLLRAIEHVDDLRGVRVAHARPAQQREEAPREVGPDVPLDARLERRARRLVFPPRRHPFVGVIHPVLERDANHAEHEAQEEGEHGEGVHLLQGEALEHEPGERVPGVLVHRGDERQRRERHEASLRGNRDGRVIVEEAVGVDGVVHVVGHEDVEDAEAREEPLGHEPEPDDRGLDGDGDGAHGEVALRVQRSLRDASLDSRGVVVVAAAGPSSHPAKSPRG
mmetsp:Transcript_4259/g.17556  ORF Transcript_4259/g.17556 Transcript_4259/m.17556 type:complete len:227 (+) Transcript_4259:1089-1769(+)